MVVWAWFYFRKEYIPVNVSERCSTKHFSITISFAAHMKFLTWNTEYGEGQRKNHQKGLGKNVFKGK